MNLPSRGIVAGVLAALALGLILFETSDALRTQLTRRPGKTGRTAGADPFARLDRLIAEAGRDNVPSTMRDPFGYGIVSVPNPRPRVAPKQTEPAVVEKPMPVLTAVVSDADPQAVIRFEGRNYTVRVGSLFADYRVLSITSDQVVLDANGETIVLHRVTKGE